MSEFELDELKEWLSEEGQTAYLEGNYTVSKGEDGYYVKSCGNLENIEPFTLEELVNFFDTANRGWLE